MHQGITDKELPTVPQVLAQLHPITWQSLLELLFLHPSILGLGLAPPFHGPPVLYLDAMASIVLYLCGLT